MAEDKYFPPECEFTINDDRTITAHTSRFQKVSGTMMGGILGCSPWSSPFQVACTIFGLNEKDISNKPAVRTGVVLEPKIIDYVSKEFKDIGVFIPAEEIFAKREGPHADWEPDFIDNVFTGHVDGVVLADDGKEYILEVKTTANVGAWEEDIPEHYKWQIYLYNHFVTKQDKAYVALGIVDSNTHADPSIWVPGTDNVALFELDIDQKMVAKTISKIRDWYANLTESTTTPAFDPDDARDVELFKHLRRLNNPLEDISTMVDDLADVDRQISEFEKSIQGLYDRQEELKKSIKEYMTANNMDKLSSASGGFTATIRDTKRVSWDTDLMKKDGINPDKYKIENISKTFTVKPVKTKEE